MALIEVVGVGFVGLTTAVVAAQAGHDVVGIESDPHRLGLLGAGVLPFSEPGLEREMRAETEAGRLRFAGLDYRGDGPAVLVVATPTPTLPSGESDTSSVRSALRRLWDAGRHSLVVIRSTLLPGTSETIVSGAGLSALADQLVHWPEFLNQGRALRESRTPDRVVIGADSAVAAARAHDLLRSLAVDLTGYERLSLRGAEAVKHFSNAVLAVNQVLGAEIARVCEGIGVDSGMVLASVAADSRLDPDLLRPRAPLVDSCLAKDLEALTRNLSVENEPSILGAALRQAGLLHMDAVQRLSRHVKAAGRHARTLIIGAGFSAAVSDTNGSLLWEVLPELEGQDVTVWDPYVDSSVERRLGRLLRRDGLTGLIRESDVAALLVPHPEVVAADWDELIPSMASGGAVLLDYADFFSRRPGGGTELGHVVHTFGNTRECPVCVG
ncbi:nucleotide sugar dehydrogenase [Streptosporangium sp. NPDC051022]|uniref:nucleotide sugar dehydrogenase n=1 Tax=Streptosporangium sp. NPDC051022 TaxID=3155752 RepID=UPI00341373C2